jgi:uncharacterized protein (DUF488 family)
MNTIYSIGYGNRQWEEVQQLLSQRGCTFLIDVRSNPFSKFNPSFSKDHLSHLCSKAGIRYVFMGNTLGGKPSSDKHFDQDGKVNYLLLAKSKEFQYGLARIITAHKKGVYVCLMCSELKPQECHRCKLIGAELKEQGIEIIHIDENGSDTSQDEVLRRLTGGQDDMFQDRPALTRSRGVYKK